MEKLRSGLMRFSLCEASVSDCPKCNQIETSLPISTSVTAVGSEFWREKAKKFEHPKLETAGTGN
jgi:hypothetical protein